MNNYHLFLELARSRRSIRRFSERAVSREDVLRLLEAARWAPSNHNRQPWRFIVLDDRRQILDLAETVRVSLSAKLKILPSTAAEYAREFMRYATFFSEAPVLIVALHKRPVSLSAALLQDLRNPALVSGEPLSVAMAVQNLLLAAHALQLGTCVLTAPLVVQEAVAGALPLPPGHDLTSLIAAGHPAESPPPPRRKSLEQIAEFRKDSRKQECNDDGK